MTFRRGIHCALATWLTASLSQLDASQLERKGDSSPLSVTTKRLLSDKPNRPSNIDSPDRVVDTSTVSIKLSLQDPPEAATVRLRIAAVDRNGNYLKTITMPDLCLVPGTVSSTTRTATLQSATLRQLVAWQIIDAKLAESSVALKLKKVESHRRAASSDVIRLSVWLENTASDGLPHLAIVQGHDADGFAVCEIVLSEHSVMEWTERSNCLFIADHRMRPSRFNQVHTWHAVPNPSFTYLKSVLLEDDVTIQSDSTLVQGSEDGGASFNCTF